jgi:hypothetical protein
MTCSHVSVRRAACKMEIHRECFAQRSGYNIYQNVCKQARHPERSEGPHM